MIVAEGVSNEYSGVLDWIGEKLGIGYVKVKDYIDLSKLRNDINKLKRANIPYKIKCKESICSLLVHKSRIRDVQNIINVSNVSTASMASGLIIAGLIGIPLVLMFMSGSSKKT